MGGLCGDYRPASASSFLSVSGKGADDGFGYQLFGGQRQGDLEENCGIPPKEEGAQTEIGGVAGKGKTGHRGVALSVGVVFHSGNKGWQQEGAGIAFQQIFSFAVWT